MSVILKTTMCGPNGSFQSGQRVDTLDAKTEQDLVDGGFAERLTPPAPVERAVIAPAVERAVAPEQPEVPVIPQPQRARRGR